MAATSSEISGNSGHGHGSGGSALSSSMQVPFGGLGRRGVEAIGRRGSDGDDEGDSAKSGSNVGSPGSGGGGATGTLVTQRWDEWTSQWRDGEMSKILDGISATFAQPVSRPEHESPLRTTTGSAATPHSSSGQFHSMSTTTALSSSSSMLGPLSSMTSPAMHSSSPISPFSSDLGHNQQYFFEESKMPLSIHQQEFVHSGQSHQPPSQQRQQRNSSVLPNLFIGGSASSFSGSATDISPSYDEFGGMASTTSNSPALRYNSNPPPPPPPPPAPAPPLLQTVAPHDGHKNPLDVLFDLGLGSGSSHHILKAYRLKPLLHRH